jgi:hypothetical protein
MNRQLRRVDFEEKDTREAARPDTTTADATADTDTERDTAPRG